MSSKSKKSSSDSRARKSGRGPAFTDDQDMRMLKIVQKVKPAGTEGWEKVQKEFNLALPKNAQRTLASLRARYKKLKDSKKPTGQTEIPETVQLAKSIQQEIEGINSVQSFECDSDHAKETESESDTSDNDSGKENDVHPPNVEDVNVASGVDSQDVQSVQDEISGASETSVTSSDPTPNATGSTASSSIESCDSTTGTPAATTTKAKKKSGSEVPRVGKSVADLKELGKRRDSSNDDSKSDDSSSTLSATAKKRFKLDAALDKLANPVSAPSSDNSTEKSSKQNDLLTFLMMQSQMEVRRREDEEIRRREEREERERVRVEQEHIRKEESEKEEKRRAEEEKRRKEEKAEEESRRREEREESDKRFLLMLGAIFGKKE